jgi:hypothetical protein
MRNRRPVAAFLLGLVLGFPLVAHSKGQWCNDTTESTRVTLTLTRATVGGTDAPPASARATSPFSLAGKPDGGATAWVRDPDCVDGTANCIGGARERRLRWVR